jgi:hypothetical protein
LDHFVSWNAGTQNKDLDVYDASGTRVLRRTTTSSGTTMTVYAKNTATSMLGPQ